MFSGKSLDFTNFGKLTHPQIIEHDFHSGKNQKEKGGKFPPFPVVLFFEFP
jgi:hypothetical protein